MNLFKNHLQTIQGKLGVPQNQLWEEDVQKRSTSLNDAIQSVYLNEGMNKKKMYEYGSDKKKMYEYGTDKKKKMEENTSEAEEVLAEYLSAYFGDSLNENTSEEEISEAIENLNIICSHLYEFLESDDSTEPSDIVKEAIDSIYETGQLSEDSSEEDLMESIDNLFHVAATINEYLASA